MSLFSGSLLAIAILVSAHTLLVALLRARSALPSVRHECKKTVALYSACVIVSFGIVSVSGEPVTRNTILMLTLVVCAFAARRILFVETYLAKRYQVRVTKRAFAK